MITAIGSRGAFVFTAARPSGSSVIVGRVVIGAEAEIADAYIGPYTSVGAYARVEGSEIEREVALC